MSKKKWTDIIFDHTEGDKNKNDKYISTTKTCESDRTCNVHEKHTHTLNSYFNESHGKMKYNYIVVLSLVSCKKTGSK